MQGSCASAVLHGSAAGYRTRRRAGTHRTGIRRIAPSQSAPPRRRRDAAQVLENEMPCIRSDPARSLDFCCCCSRLSAQSCRRSPRTRRPRRCAFRSPQRSVTSLNSAEYAPVSATQLGDHRFDADLDDMSAAGRARTLAWVKELLGQLQGIDRSHCSRANQVDAADAREPAALLRSGPRKNSATGPGTRCVYTQLAGQAIYGLLAREFAPLPDAAALRDGTARADAAPARADARQPRSGACAGDPRRNCRACRIPAC